MSFKELIPVPKADYDRWRIKTQFREYNPSYREMLNLSDQMTEIDNNKELGSDEKTRLRALLQTKLIDVRKQLPTTDPMAMASEHLPEKMAAPVRSVVESIPVAPVSPARTVSVFGPSSLGQKSTADVAPDLVEMVGTADGMLIKKKDHVALYNDLMRRISENPDKIGVSRDQELILDGSVIPESNARDLIRSLFLYRAGHKTVGLTRFLYAIHNLGIRAHHIPEKQAHSRYVKMNLVPPESVDADEFVDADAQQGNGLRLNSVHAKSKRLGPPGKRNSLSASAKRVRVLKVYR